jgi:hypothetical protein
MCYYLLALWHDLAGVPFDGQDPALAIDILRRTEWSSDFEQKMRNRMIIGALRYGPAGRPGQYLFCAGRHIALYEMMDNLEHLVDAANYLMLEYMAPAHAEAHFHAEDRT